MRVMGLFVMVAALAWPVAGVASSFAGTSAGSASNASSDGSSASSGSSSGDDKVVLEAREDAASFVATDGQIRGAFFEAALSYLRQHDADARAATDMALARHILSR